MSRSQSRCMMLILRHAWLNLLDKHMTTGRINQVAVVLVYDSGSRLSDCKPDSGFFNRCVFEIRFQFHNCRVPRTASVPEPP